ncbi:MAG: CinA family protein [Eubacteriales bacterium]
MKTAKELVALLAREGLTLSVAESLTGGMTASAMVSVPGVSAVFAGGLVSYTYAAKQSLGVSPAVLAAHTAISPETAVEMAARCKEFFATSLAVSVTGNAGPTPQDNQPIGCVYIAVQGQGQPTVLRHRFRGTRNRIRRQAARAALAAVIFHMNDRKQHKENKTNECF